MANFRTIRLLSIVLDRRIRNISKKGDVGFASSS